MTIAAILPVLDVGAFALGQFVRVVQYIVDRHNGPEEEAVRAMSTDYALLTTKLVQVCRSALGEDFCKCSKGIEMLRAGCIHDGIMTLQNEYYQQLKLVLGPTLGSICRILSRSKVVELDEMEGVSFVNHMRAAYHTAAPWSVMTSGDITGRISDMTMPYVDKSRFMGFLELLDRLRYYEMRGVGDADLKVAFVHQARLEQTGTFDSVYGKGLKKFYDVRVKSNRKCTLVVVDLIPLTTYVSLQEVLTRLKLEEKSPKVSEISTAEYRYPDDESDSNMSKYKIMDTLLGGQLDNFMYYSCLLNRTCVKLCGEGASIIDLTHREMCIRMFGIGGEVSDSGLVGYLDRLQALAYTCAIFTSVDYLAKPSFASILSGVNNGPAALYPSLPPSYVGEQHPGRYAITSKTDAWEEKSSS